jgi:hypothetical protein
LGEQKISEKVAEAFYDNFTKHFLFSLKKYKKVSNIDSVSLNVRKGYLYMNLCDGSKRQEKWLLLYMTQKALYSFGWKDVLVLDCLSRSQKLTESSMTRQMDFCDPLNN